MKASIKFYSKFRIQKSEFGIQNSEFGIQNSEFRIQNSEFRIQNYEILLTFKSYLQWFIGPILQCNSYVHNNPCCIVYHSRLGCTGNCSRVVFLRLVSFKPGYTSPETSRADGPESSHVIVQRGSYTVRRSVLNRKKKL